MYLDTKLHNLLRLQQAQQQGSVGAMPFLNRLGMQQAMPGGVSAGVALRQAPVVGYALEPSEFRAGTTVRFDIVNAPGGSFMGWAFLLYQVAGKGLLTRQAAVYGSGERLSAVVSVMPGEIPFMLLLANNGPAPAVTLFRP